MSMMDEEETEYAGVMEVEPDIQNIDVEVCLFCSSRYQYTDLWYLCRYLLYRLTIV